MINNGVLKMILSKVKQKKKKKNTENLFYEFYEASAFLIRYMYLCNQNQKYTNMK